jgi:hypothetical protein
MVKNKYIAMRNQGIIDAQLLYIYAIDKGFKYGINEFIICLNHSDITYIINILDSEFELTRLYDKNDKFIKIIE